MNAALQGEPIADTGRACALVSRTGAGSLVALLASVTEGVAIHADKDGTGQAEASRLSQDR